MKYLLEALFARLWNRLGTRHKRHVENRALDIGAQIVDGEPAPYRMALPQARRAEHIAILGKTGSGKSFLLRHLATQDIKAGRGFCYFDLHGDATEFLVATVAAKERALKEDLSERLIVIEPANPEGLRRCQSASGTIGG